MQCPSCKNLETRVIDSRVTNDQKSIRRRRECEGCKYRFTTFETIASPQFIVIKKDNTRENYSREKLERGIWKACEKRPISQDDVDKLIKGMEDDWLSQGKEISSEDIGSSLMKALKKLDQVAYIRFASVYREFQDVDSFKKELRSLLK